MNKLVFTSTLLAFLLAGNQVHNNTTPPTQTITAPVVTGDPLTEAIKSAVMIRLEHYGNSGTGTFVGRVKTPEGLWRYQIMTAFHVIEEFALVVPEESVEDARKRHKLTLAIQESFHSLPKTFETYFIDMSWSVPAQDWAIFSCELPDFIPCAELATEEEFKTIQPYDHIYGVGSDDAQGLFFKEGVIATSNNVEPFTHRLFSDAPWHMSPDIFFRPYHSVWFGASGGPIFTRQGKIIGLYNTLCMGQLQPSAHAVVALKTHIIRQTLEAAKSKTFVKEK